MKCTKYCGDLSWQIIAKVLSGPKTEDKVLRIYFSSILIALVQNQLYRIPSKRRGPQYPAPSCTTLLYFNGTPRSENPILAFSWKVGLPYF
jgi:hypothetical protein